MTRPSCHRFRSNEVRLRLSVIARTLRGLWKLPFVPSAATMEILGAR